MNSDLDINESEHSDGYGLAEIIEDIISNMPGFITGYLSTQPRRRRRHGSRHVQTSVSINGSSTEIQMTTYLSPEGIDSHHVQFVCFPRPPAPILIISHLPAKIIDDEMFEILQTSSSSSCCICLDDFRLGDEISTLSCEHTFHPECIKSWLRLTNSCPICREGRAISHR